VLIALGLSVLAVIGAAVIRIGILASRPDLGSVRERGLSELRADSFDPSRRPTGAGQSRHGAQRAQTLREGCALLDSAIAL